MSKNVKIRQLLFAAREGSSNLAKSPAKNKQTCQSKHENLHRDYYACKYYKKQCFPLVGLVSSFEK